MNTQELRRLADKSLRAQNGLFALYGEPMPIPCCLPPESLVKLLDDREKLLEALKELTECGAEAWGEYRPCVKDGRAAIAQCEQGVRK